MIEMRIVDNGLMCRPDFQYRFMLFPIGQGGYLCPPNETMNWSEWRTAEWINAEDIENE
jgi:hypothetical protein